MNNLKYYDPNWQVKIHGGYKDKQEHYNCVQCLLHEDKDYLILGDLPLVDHLRLHQAAGHEVNRDIWKWFGQDLQHKINYQLCTSLDILRIGIVLDRMVNFKLISQHKANVYKSMSEDFLTLLRTENNKRKYTKLCNGEIPDNRDEE